ncbi:MAG TPA: class I SAM-dependent methyltransferase [Caldilineaceae bacterium]|nr:class I SAM-dependent methyltransferase [Caldilineaceae bacterium]
MGSSNIQGDLWGAAAHDWATLQEPLHGPLWDAMLAATSVGPGTRLLDAGCGSGGASLLALQRGAAVKGLDAAKTLINIARQRAPPAEFWVGDLEDLPYDAAEFDVVFASLSVQYAADPVAALGELKRVCAPDGCLAISTWGPEDGCEQRVIFQAIREILPSPPPGAGPFALSAPGQLEAFVAQAGWQVQTREIVACPFVYPDLATHWQVQRSAGPVQTAIRTVGEEQVRAAVDQAVAPYQLPDGGVRLENCFLYVVATQ